MDEEINEVEGLGLHPCVTLVVSDEFGKVKLLEHIGEGVLGEFLKNASEIGSNPIKEDSFLLDCRGQEIYTLSDYEYFTSIAGTFLSVSDIGGLVKACAKEELKFTFIVSY